MTDRSSKYDALGAFLADFEGNELEMSLAEIAEVVGPLPHEATYNRFWANVVDHHDARRRQWLDNGFRAYFNRSVPSVRFVRDTEDRSGKPWSDAELMTCVVAYRRLWEAEQRGEELNKSELRRQELAGGLAGRVKGSYEFRMQNISALLDELGLPFVRGYLPRKNVGNLKMRLVSIINDVWHRSGIAETPTADPEALNTRVVAALDKLKSKGGSQPPGTTNVKRSLSTLSRFIRDPDVIAWVVLRAAGRCEACGEAAPFNRTDGTPFLEVHHVRPLAEGGPDVVTNALATCPNCHRRLHHGTDRQKFRRSILKLMPALLDYPKKAIEQQR
ncbi:HNH endonuclease [Rhizobium leguminosarum]|uniref:HNH endonuclease n=1 Tax=Rhizobium leguminosarum TaxID=384 RepID=UPI00144182C5|nr:HNH endonuclease signature motif containing protein [Rhizobium leguminosarum]MBY5867843.1 HNH endonuclease [Rhizobium leguminosarum]NKM06480.1 HNH endonuclease [Rhizobium leguminosarum bv. viciae]